MNDTELLNFVFEYVVELHQPLSDANLASVEVINKDGESKFHYIKRITEEESISDFENFRIGLEKIAQKYVDPVDSESEKD